MASDSHCHPYDLSFQYLDAENERVRLGIPIAASAWNAEDFLFNKSLSHSAPLCAPVALMFAAHPQMTAAKKGSLANQIPASLELLEKLCAEHSINAIGECGFDLFTAAFKAAEKIQDEIFAVHLKLAIKYDLPLVLHIRKAMHKVFANIDELKRIKSIVFHSYSGTKSDAESILNHGVNAFFSFGSNICNNHKTAVQACTSIPVARILFETDAPYQPLKNYDYSSYSNLSVIIQKAAFLKNMSKKDLEEISDITFHRIYF